MTNPPSMNTRRYDLDWLRVGAFGLLILYHVGMFYVTWPWHVKSGHASPALEPLMALANPWRLPLLFLISGVALRFAHEKTSAGALAVDRLRRLLPVIVFGMAVVVMPQAYFELVSKGELAGSILAFWREYLDPDQEFSIITPTWNHLWYVVYVLVYALLLAPVARPLARFASGPSERLFALLGRDPTGLSILVLPALPFVAYRLLLDPIFPTHQTLIGDWANHAHSLTILLYGFVLAKSPAFWVAVDRNRRAALAGAVCAGMLVFALRSNWDMVRADETLWLAAQVLRPLYAWLVILALLGLAQRWLNRPGRALTYLNEAVLPFYILHQTLIVVIGFALTGVGLSVWTEASLVIGGTVLGCVAGYEIIRRVAPLRPLFGLRWTERRASTIAVSTPAE